MELKSEILDGHGEPEEAGFIHEPNNSACILLRVLNSRPTASYGLER
jgi:hypothetical protein